MANPNQTIIIKRIKKVAGGHHGGAWKVAYADFVTAMMAFFLLLWLLNATEAENLAGLADYFAPTVGVKDQMGIGFRGGKAALSEGIGADKNTNKGVVFGGVPTGPITKVTTEIKERTDQDEQEKIEVLINDVNTQKKGSHDNTDEQNAAALTSVIKTPDDANEEEIKKTQQAVQNVINDMVKDRRLDEGSVEIRRTPEGLLIEIKDLTGNSMFENETAVMKKKLKNGLSELSKILRNLPNTLAIIGHTSSTPLQTKNSGYTKWELSADRANASRALLIKNGVAEEQISRIEGRADNVPYDRRRPEAVVNNRIDIIILSKNDMPDHKKTAPESILIDTKSDMTKRFLEETQMRKEKEEKEKAKKTPVIQDNQEIKNLLRESSDTRIEADKIDGQEKEEMLNNKGDMIDLKIDNSDKKPKTTVMPQSNQKFESILDEDVQQEALDIKPAEKRELLKNADIIDFGAEKTAPVAPAPKPGMQKITNSQFEQILDDSRQVQKRALTMDPQTKKNLLNKDIMDLGEEEPKPAEVKQTPARQELNPDFRNILKESRKAANAPVTKTSNPFIENNVIDLTIDHDTKQKKEPKKENTQNTNTLFQNILDESEQLKIKAQMKNNNEKTTPDN